MRLRRHRHDHQTRQVDGQALTDQAVALTEQGKMAWGKQRCAQAYHGRHGNIKVYVSRIPITHTWTASFAILEGDLYTPIDTTITPAMAAQVAAAATTCCDAVRQARVRAGRGGKALSQEQRHARMIETFLTAGQEQLSQGSKAS